MKTSTAVFASILSICITASFVSGQVKFADGTEQTTAYDGKSAVLTAEAFNYTLSQDSNTPGGAYQLSQAVPSGKELVILQANRGPGYPSGVLLSLLPSPNQATDPIAIAACLGAYANGVGFAVTHTYIDGIVVVDEGRELWFDENFADVSSNYGTGPFTVLGYFRDKT